MNKFLFSQRCIIRTSDSWWFYGVGSFCDALLKIQSPGRGYPFGPVWAISFDSSLEILLTGGRGFLNIPLECYHWQESRCLAGKANRCPLHHLSSVSVYLSSRSLTKMLNKTRLTTGATGSPPGISPTMYIIIDNCSFPFSQVLASVMSFTQLPV